MSRNLFTYRPLLAVALIGMFALAACDSGVDSTPDTSTPTDPTSDFTPEERNGGQTVYPDATPQPDDTASIPAPEVPGLGEEDPSKLIPVGFLNGTWRVGINDPNDAPVMHIDFVHDKGQATASCDFVMHTALAENFADKIGKCSDLTFNEGTGALTFKFNPTEDFEYNMLVSLKKIDDNTLQGDITAPSKGVGQDDVYPVSFSRFVPDPQDDGVRPAAP